MRRRVIFNKDGTVKGYDPPMTPEELARFKERGNRNFKEMIESGRAPLVRSNTSFLSQFGACGAQFAGQDHVGDDYRRQAQRLGVDPTGKVYISQLAEYPGDPYAWVSDKDEIVKKCELKGWGAKEEDRELAKVIPGPAPAEIPLAPEIIEERLEEAILTHPDPENITGEDLDWAREQIIEKHTPQWGPPETG